MLNDNNLQNEFLGRAGERRAAFPGIPLSPTLSPLVPRGEREKNCVRGLTNSTAVHPGPLPQGEGETHSARRPGGRAGIGRRLEHDSPSPGGEDRGEGGL